MKKLVIGATAMGGAALIAFGGIGTFAALNDTQTLADQTVGAGTLTVSADRTATSAAASTGSLKPGGDTVDFAYFVMNDQASAVDGSVSGSVINLVDLENNCNASELDPGTDGQPLDKTCDWNQGEFSKFATVSGSMKVGGDKATCAYDSNASASLGTLAQVANTPKFTVPGTVAPGQGVCVVLRVGLPQTADNTVQGDSAKFDVKFTLSQS